MANDIRVISSHVDKKPNIEQYNHEKGVFIYKEKSSLYGALDWDGDSYAYEFNIAPGYVTNYASVPRRLQWVLPSYVLDDPVYNAFSALHDWLYSVGGDTGQYILPRLTCDDIFSTGIRTSNTIQTRRCPGLLVTLADLGVGLFAGGSKHWKNDSYNVAQFATFTMTQIP